MTTDALIRELVERVEPVRPVGSPLIRFATWGMVTAAWIVLAVAVAGIRGDLASAARAPGFVLQVMVPLVVGLAATGAAFGASVPSRGSRWWTGMLALMVATLMVWAGGGALWAAGGPAGVGFRCIRNLVAFGVPPGLFLSLMLRKAAPLDHGAVGLLAALGASALAQAGTRFVCHQDGALHILVWHYSFVFALGAAGVVMGRALFR